MSTPAANRGRRHLSSTRLAALVSLAYLILVGGGGVAILQVLTHASGSAEVLTVNGQVPAAAPPSDFFPAGGGAADDSPSSSAETVPELSSETSAVPDLSNYEAVSGPDGLTTDVPVNWTPDPTTGSSTLVQLDDPDDPGQFVRYGDGPVPDGDLVSGLAAAARTNPRISDGYHQLALESVSFHGDPAADWEFQFRKDGVLRHVHARYWLVGGHEYFVYVSGPDSEWDQLMPIFTTMADTAQP